jgi:glutaredoxin
MKRRAILLASLAALAPACSKKKDDGTAPVPAGSLPALSIRNDTPELMLTWIDDKGDTHVALHPPEVPEAGRSLVRVVVADREAGTHDLFYVSDLTKKKDDGSYDTRALRRREWEDEIEKRRVAYLTKLAPPKPSAPGSGEPATPPPVDHGGFTVIIYGASWCGPCHQAEAYLKKKGIPHVMKDIESTPGAAAEMQDKLRRAGRSGGSIPVIDVRGQILVGWNPQMLDRAIAKAGAGTTL